MPDEIGWPITSSLHPDYVHTSLTVQAWLHYMLVDEIVEMKKLVNTLPDNPIVINIGAGGGTSGLAIIESRDDVILYTVDIQDAPSPFGCLSGERDVFKKAKFDHLLGSRWFQIHGDSKDVGRAWTGPGIDMVFIDGDHTYDGCRGDIESWMPKMKPGGVLSIHDFDKAGKDERTGGDDTWSTLMHPKAYPGVDQSVRDVLTPTKELISMIGTMVTFRV